MTFPDSPISKRFILLNDQIYQNGAEEQEDTLMTSNFGKSKQSFIPLYVVGDKKGYPLNREVPKYLSEKLKLFYSPLGETGGDVCFLNSEEVRPEYKLSFSSRDIFDYITGYLASNEYASKYKDFLHKGFSVVPFPDNEIEFWRFVQMVKENKS